MEAGQKEQAQANPYVHLLNLGALGPITADEAKLNFENAFQHNPKAVVIIGFATGTTPDILNPFIQQSVEKDIPVFILSSNYARDTGIQQVSYGPHQEAIDAGATLLKDINVNGTFKLIDAIQKASNQGFAGKRLNDAISTQFSIPAKRPVK